MHDDPDYEPLTLPRGGLVAFRKSGGFRFSSRGFVVYRWGQVVPLAGTEGRARRLSAEARAALRHRLLMARLGQIQVAPGGGRRDGYGYELVARIGLRTRSLEFDDGAIPPELARLVELLQRLMPQ
jgi:hypothetical protein